MTRARSLTNLLRSAAAPALGILVIANFAGYALLGPNGLLAWGDYARLSDQRQIELAQLSDERDRLANRVALLNPDSVDPDFADELVRRNTGQVREDEHIVITD
jgi:cell division protein FtsB